MNSLIVCGQPLSKINKEDSKLKKTSAVFEGTFLAIVMGLIDKGEFVGIDMPVKDGEEVIGDMTSFEKGLRTYASYASKKEAEILADLKELMKADHEPPEFGPKVSELGAIRDGYEIANKLMWNSIKSRLNAWKFEVGIREDYKVVKLKEEKDDENCSCLACQLKKSLLGGSASISVIGVGIR